MIRPLPIVLLLCTVSGAGAQTGLSARPGELPALEAQIRNQGPVAVVVRPEAFSNVNTTDVPAMSMSAEGNQQVSAIKSTDATQEDDSELAEVSVGATRIQPGNGLPRARCIPETYIETRLTPEQQATEAADQDLRRGREVVEKHLIAGMTRDQSVLKLIFSHSEDRGDEIWFFYGKDLSCSGIAHVSHGVITSWNRKTGEILGRGYN